MQQREAYEGYEVMATKVSSVTTPDALPYTVRQRMEHIERCLFWKGELQRADLVDRFGVNPVQAASDFSTYMAIAPGNMDYNKSRKRYLPLPGFLPKFIEPASLDEFASVASPIVGVEKWPLPSRSVDSETLQAVVKAIRQREALEIRYQSMTDAKPSWRWISPHAFASDGDRWHVRAFCHKRGAFRDFVLSRIGAARHARASDARSENDTDWHTYIEITLAPNPLLSAEQQSAIAAEYNMPRKRQLTVRLRKSMLFYVNVRFFPEPDSVAAAHQLVLVNTEANFR